MTSEDLIKQAINEPLRKPDGIEIVPSEKPSMTIGFDEIDPPKKKRRIPEYVKDWRVNHFASYLRRLHIDRYGKDWKLNYSGVCGDFNNTFDFIIEIKGECSNKTMYDYVTWFFENIADEIISKQGGFYPSQLRQDWVVDRFFDNRDSLKKKPSIKKVHSSLDEDEMRSSMLLGMDRFLSEYGIVIAVNWNLKHEGLDKAASAKTVYESLVRMKDRGMLDSVIKKTESFNPYPKLPFTDAAWLLGKVDDSAVVDIQVNTRRKSDLKKILS